MFYYLKIFTPNKLQAIFFPTVEIKCYNVMNDIKKFFDQTIKKSQRTYNNIGKLRLLKEMVKQPVVYLVILFYYKTIAIDLCKQEALDADPKVLPQINLTCFLFSTKQKKLSYSFEKELWKYYSFFSLWYKLTKYNTLNAKLSNTKPNKLKSRIKLVLKLL